MNYQTYRRHWRILAGVNWPDRAGDWVGRRARLLKKVTVMGGSQFQCGETVKVMAVHACKATIKPKSGRGKRIAHHLELRHLRLLDE